jgi:hypothetical protein
MTEQNKSKCLIQKISTTKASLINGKGQNQMEQSQQDSQDVFCICLLGPWKKIKFQRQRIISYS